MRSYAVLLALLPLCFAVFSREYLRKRFRSEYCLVACQTSVHGQFNLSATSRPREFQEFCEFAQKLTECFEECPETPASPLMKQNAERNAQICANDWDQKRFQEFRDAQNRMAEQWAWQTMVSCPRPQFDASRMFEKCSLFLNCFFGDALNAVKDGFEELAVASVVVPLKLEYASKIGNRVWTEDVVDECSVLFAPYGGNHSDPSSLAAPACLQYCQTTGVPKFTGNRPRNQPPEKAVYCEYTRALDDCFEKCQESPITPVLKQHADVTVRICAPDFSEEQLRAFFLGQKEFGNKWLGSTGRCRADGPGPAGTDMEPVYEKCGVFLNCFFDEAFNAAKDDYDELIIAATSAQYKIQHAAMLAHGAWSEDVVDECFPVFNPYQAQNVSSVA